MTKSLFDVSEADVKALYDGSPEINQAMTWEEVKDCGYIFKLLRNQVAAARMQKSPNLETIEYPPVPKAEPSPWGPCYLSEYDAQSVFIALQAARHVIAFNAASEASRRDTLETIRRACQLINRKTKVKHKEKKQ